jgi:hypothetical protein
MAKLIIQEKLILANPKVKDSQADKFRAMALPGADEHYRSSVQYAYKNMDTRLYKSTKGGGFHDKVKASAKRHILDKFADHGITPNHAHIDRELDKAMAHWNKTQKGLKMKGVTEGIKISIVSSHPDSFRILKKHGYELEHSDGKVERYNKPSFHVVHIYSDGKWKYSKPGHPSTGTNGTSHVDLKTHLDRIHR